MNRYENSIPRAALGLAALVMTVITLSMSVILPARMDTGSAEVRTLAAPAVSSPAPTEVAITRTSIEVIGVREPHLVSVKGQAIKPKCKQAA